MIGFFEWVATTRRVTDSPRGDFVSDTKDLWRIYKDEDLCQHHFDKHACVEAQQIERKMKRLYNRECRRKA